MNDLKNYSQVFKVRQVFSIRALIILWYYVICAFHPQGKQKLIPKQIPWREKNASFGAPLSSHKGLFVDPSRSLQHPKEHESAGWQTYLFSHISHIFDRVYSKCM